MNVKTLALVLLVVFFGISCGSAKKRYDCEQPPFLIPPGVTTVEGEDPYAKVRSKPVADIYWDNTQSQFGYTQNKGDGNAKFTQFFRIVTRHITGGNYRPRYWLLRPDNRNFLRWKNVTHLNPEEKDFYTFKGVPENRECGPLTMIYDGDLIEPKNLTIVVSDLEEQGLNITLLTDLIRNKLTKFDDYSAAVIATRLPFDGINYRPDYKRLNKMVELDYKGEKPIYVIVSGPRDAVKSFLNAFSNFAEKYSFEYHVATTVQKGERKALDIFKEVEIPESATATEINMQMKKAGFKPNLKNPDSYEVSRAKERIWNLEERTDATIDYLGLSVEGKLERVKEKLGLRLFEYKKVIPSWKNDNWLWALNIAFKLPKGVKTEDLECMLKNYRYFAKVQKKIESEVPDEKQKTLEDKVADGKEDDSKDLKEELVLLQWEQNDEFIRKGLDVYKFNTANKDDKCVFCIYPKDKYGELESSVVCFDFIVKTKQKIEIPEWVESFNDDDFLHPELNQNKTFNFREFVNNLLKDEVIESVEYVNDELIRLPIMLFNMPFHSAK